MNAWNLEGKIALVTGASEGIGFATVKELTTLGARVVMVSRSREKLERAASELSDGRFVETVAADLTTTSGRSAVIDRIAQLGKLDILVNNLGGSSKAKFVDTGLTDFEAQTQLNLVASLELTRLLASHLTASKGNIVNVTSIAAHRALPDRFWYGTAKAALEHATRHLASEWGPLGIRVNAVAPWFTSTRLTSAALADANFSDRLERLTPLRRLAKPEDIARVITFLTLPAAGYVTGVILPVDGGFLAQGGL